MICFSSANENCGETSEIVVKKKTKYLLYFKYALPKFQKVQNEVNGCLIEIHPLEFAQTKKCNASHNNCAGTRVRALEFLSIDDLSLDNKWQHPLSHIAPPFSKHIYLNGYLQSRPYKQSGATDIIIYKMIKLNRAHL